MVGLNVLDPYSARASYAVGLLVRADQAFQLMANHRSAAETRRDSPLQQGAQTSDRSQIMRTTILLSVGVGVVILGLLFRLLRGRQSRPDAGAVSGQWLAEKSWRSDQPGT